MAEGEVVVNSALEALRDGDRAKFRSTFWSPLTLIVTEARAGSIFDLSTFMLGPLESWTKPELHKDGRFKQYKTYCKFQRSHQALTLSAWGDKLVGVGIGLAMDLGLVPSWISPSYVDNDSFTEEDINIRPSYLLPAITGSLTVPKTPGRKPAVLLIPGSGPVDRDETAGGGKCFRDIAHGLSSNGIITLRMDKPVSIVYLKQLVTKNLTLEDEYIQPGIAALRYLSTHPSVDPSQISILGHSLGGCVAPRLCKASPIPIAGIISCASSTSKLAHTISRQMNYLHSKFPRADPAQRSKEIEQYDAVARCIDAGGPQKGQADPTKALAIPIPLSYLLDVAKNDPIEIARTLDVPMLFVQGKEDWQVTVEHEYMAWQTGMEGAVAESKMLWNLYEGVGHMLGVVAEGKHGNFMYDERYSVSEEIVRDVVGFVKSIGQMKDAEVAAS